MTPRLESLWNFYQEHAAQARQHEDQREHMTSIILLISGALITFVSSHESATIYSFLSSLALIPLGIFGWAFSYKHYERNHIHRAILAKIREAIDEELTSPCVPGQNVPTLKQLRDAGELSHYADFPAPRKRPQRNAKNWIARCRLNPFWYTVPLLVTILGIVFASFQGHELSREGGAKPAKKISVTYGG